MTRATLELTHYEDFTMDVPGYLDFALPAPAGTKSMITVIVSGAGASGATAAEFRSSAFSTISCTRLFNQPMSGTFCEVWYAMNVPINTSPTTFLRLTGASSLYGSLEWGYWDAVAIAHFHNDGPHAGATSGGMAQPPGSTDTDTVYGILGLLPSQNVALAGTPDMVAVAFDGYDVVPPVYTNDHGENVGYAPQVSAPRATTSFIHEPTTAGYTFSYTFSASTTWWLNLMRLTGPVVVVTAIPARLATIVG